MATQPTLPDWANDLRQRYLRGEAAQFILHGNVHDVVLHEGKELPIEEFLATVMLGGNKDTIVSYNNSTGVKFNKRKPKLEGLEELVLHRSRDKVLPLLERALVTESRFALLLTYAETLCPAADLSMYSDTDRSALVTLHRWASLPALEHSDNLVIMLTENLSELHPRLVNNARVSAIRIPLPSEGERKAFVKHLAPRFDQASIDRLAEITAGLKMVQVRGILSPDDLQDDVDDRKKLITELLGEEGTPERVEGLAKITKGMGAEEIRQLVAPKKALPGAGNGITPEMERLIAKHKRSIIERECAGLLEFVEPKHGFEVVGGMEEVKRELNRVAKAIREGNVGRVPMGFLFVGPMGTGKTFVAEAFAKESDLTAVKFGSFRSKWVGATESNLDRILDVISGMGQVIVIIDEVDRALAGNDGGSDGGTESRVIARLKEFMSDSQNRGRILFILMTNRPDLLDTDIKRTGRLDRKIPFFYSQTPEDVLPILSALLKRHKLKPGFDVAAQQKNILEKLVGWSNADIEGVVLLGASLADTAGRRDTPTLEDMQKAVDDYLPSRDVNILEFMELLAVYEASNKSMLPKKYQGLSPQELSDKLQAARLRVGHRR
ncbi:MAG: ATP-binding protein [Deltaproteobacteria bacterium]|nr:ATP-binding protein [Deltaproteobacteria bacterium]